MQANCVWCVVAVVLFRWSHHVVHAVECIAVFVVEHVSLLLAKVCASVGKGLDDGVIGFVARDVGRARGLLDRVRAPPLIRSRLGNGARPGRVPIGEAVIGFIRGKGRAKVHPIAPDHAELVSTCLRHIDDYVFSHISHRRSVALLTCSCWSAAVVSSWTAHVVRNTRASCIRRSINGMHVWDIAINSFLKGVRQYPYGISRVEDHSSCSRMAWRFANG